MVGFASKDDYACPQLLNLIPKERECFLKEDDDDEDEETNLELRLGPPVKQGSRIKHDGFFKNSNTNNTSSGAKRVFSDIKEAGIERVNDDSQDQSFQAKKVFSDIKEPGIERVNGGGNQNQSFQSPCPWRQKTKPPFLQLQPISKSIPVMENESSQPCSSQQNVFSPSPAAANNNNTAVPCPSSSDQKRIGGAPVVGWPPIRSSRKNLIQADPGGKVEKSKNGLFVKINMEGVAIGRKVDLKAHDSYEKLSCVVDKLFRGLVAAQRDGDGGEKAITGLLDGSGEFTLVYQDNEGEIVLVGDVPWHMFVCSVRRLRVIKTSQIPKLLALVRRETHNQMMQHACI